MRASQQRRPGETTGLANLMLVPPQAYEIGIYLAQWETHPNAHGLVMAAYTVRAFSLRMAKR